MRCSHVIAALVWAAVLALGGFLGAANAAANELRLAPASEVALSTALADAHRLAAPRGDKVVRVEGRSMLPYFGEGAVLVVRSCAADSLREGMVVVYRNRFGETVAHRIEARSGEGWTVRGANNAVADSTLVTDENLLGTVYVTLYSDPRGAMDATRLAGGLAAGTAVALAAPAR